MPEQLYIPGDLAELMPDEWPILEAEDFCHGAFGTGCQHCSLGWIATVMGTPPQHDESIIHVIRPEYFRVQKLFIDFVQPPGGAPIPWNDRTPKDELARTWNRFGAALGYTEGNPEA